MCFVKTGSVFWMLYSGHIGVLVNMYIVLIFILKSFVEYFIY